jgi:hypothetical protein
MIRQMPIPPELHQKNRKGEAGCSLSLDREQKQEKYSPANIKKSGDSG